MPPKIKKIAPASGQKSLFSFFQKPPAPVATTITPAGKIVAKTDGFDKSATDSANAKKRLSPVKKNKDLAELADDDSDAAFQDKDDKAKRRRRLIVSDDEEFNDSQAGDACIRSSANTSMVNTTSTPMGSADDANEKSGIDRKRALRNNKKPQSRPARKSKPAKKMKLGYVCDDDFLVDSDEEDEEEDSDGSAADSDSNGDDGSRESDENYSESEASDDADSESDDEDAEFNSDYEEKAANRKRKKASATKAKPSKSRAAANKPAMKTPGVTPTPKRKMIMHETTASGGAGQKSRIITPASTGGSAATPASINYLEKFAASAALSQQSATKPSLNDTPDKRDESDMLKKVDLPEGVVGRGSHEHNAFEFLQPAHRKDAKGRRPDHAEYNPRTLYVPASFLKQQTPAMQQWWHFKAANMDTVLFFKVGRFYELFHMDADVGFSELDLIYMKGTKAHSGFPEISYGKFASSLVAKGYRVARVEQTETPEMLKERNDGNRSGKKDKVVARELCSVMSRGTRTYCHLDDLSLLESAGSNEQLSTSVLMCIKETQVESADAAAEYGICCVNTVLGVVTLAQYQDDAQRSRLRTMLARYRPTEVLLQYGHHSAETLGAVQLIVPKAAVEQLRSEEMPSADGALDALRKGCYFQCDSSASADDAMDTWPSVMSMVVNSFREDQSSEPILCAIGGALWQLRRSLIDYEVLSLGKCFAYVPPDETDSQPAAAATAQGSGPSPAAEVSMPTKSPFAGCHGEGHNDPFSGAVSMTQGGAQSQESVGQPPKKTMTLDEIALSNLEILVNNYDRSEVGSLWAFLNNGQTPFGRRLLRSWLCNPLYQSEDIIRRQDAVAELLGPLADAVVEAKRICRKVPDLERLLARVHSNGLRRVACVSGRKGPQEHPDNRAVMYENYNIRKVKDFADILTGFELLCQVGRLFADMQITSPLLQLALTQRTDSSPGVVPATGGALPLQEMEALLKQFREVFDEKQAKKEGNIRPRRGVNAEYDQAFAEIAETEKSLEEYLREMKVSLGISDLSYYGSNKDRYQIEVPIAKCAKVPRNWTSKSQKKTHRRYRTPEIESMFAQLVDAEERLETAQKDTLRSIFSKFDSSRAVWDSAVSCFALFDALQSLSTVSSYPEYTRPEILDPRSNAAQIDIVGGRHPMLELSMLQRGGNECIPNDLSLGGCSAEGQGLVPKMLLLSGPNMGGKSTLLRQTCLLSIMAQMGCWVPAARVVMTPVDRIFTRVGASDRILAGQSTFFVELAETATILNAATEHSICILDELGRGTATFDGTAIAHAVVEHLVSKTRCRALFATHYHSLVDDWAIDPRVKLGHMDCFVSNKSDSSGCKDRDGGSAEEEVVFLYKLSEGSSPKSYGINVARLAGLPAAVIEEALQQSRAFEERISGREASTHSAVIDGAADALTSAGDRIAILFERLVSIANADVPLQELVYVAQEMWKRMEAENRKNQIF